MEEVGAQPVGGVSSRNGTQRTLCLAALLERSEGARRNGHGVHHHGVARAHVGEQPFERGALGVLARRCVDEYPIHLAMRTLAV